MSASAFESGAFPRIFLEGLISVPHPKLILEVKDELRVGHG